MTQTASLILTLLTALRVVESTDGKDPRANGNDYQITRRCLDDVNRIYGLDYRWPDDVCDRETAENVVFLYLNYYAAIYEREYHRVPSRAVIAKIYHCGYAGFKRGDKRGDRYARKVERAYRNSNNKPNNSKPSNNKPNNNKPNNNKPNKPNEK